MTPEIAAEAAVWVARLHGPARSQQMKRDCLAWQARSAAHRHAFEACTDTWQDMAGMTLRSYARAAGSAVPEPVKAEPPTSRRWVLASAAAAVAATAGLGGWRLFTARRDAGLYVTAVGEQRLVVLADGTRMSLNTATRVRVSLGESRRTVDVEGGEALFEVAKDKRRPFVVRAAGSEVVATGTAFTVRLTPSAPDEPEALDVTLVEGRVVVQGAEKSREPLSAALTSPVEMSPGERLRVVSSMPGRSAKPARPQVDRPRMDQVLAWKRGEAVFDNASLAEAVAEMNRYSAAPIVVGDAPALEALRVSGVYQTGDNASFARAVAALHGLAVQPRAEGWELVPR